MTEVHHKEFQCLIIDSTLNKNPLFVDVTIG